MKEKEGGRGGRMEENGVGMRTEGLKENGGKAKEMRERDEERERRKVGV